MTHESCFARKRRNNGLPELKELYIDLKTINQAKFYFKFYSCMDEVFD